MVIPAEGMDARPKRTSSVMKLSIGAAVLLLVGSVAYGVMQPARIDPGSRTLPEFSLAYLDGSGELSRADVAGRPLVMNFWASWCGPCREEAPLLERKWREYERQGVLFVGVVVRDTPEDALAFVRKHDLSYPMVWDPDQSLAGTLGLVGLPQTFFVDTSGRFVAHSSGERGAEPAADIPTLGAIEEEELDRQIARLLEGTP